MPVTIGRMPDVEAVLADQAGVIARRQALAHGLTPPRIQRLLSRRHWAVVHPGVYVDHTGPLTWHQRAWAAVLFSWPAALSHESALRAGDGPGRRDAEERVVHVAVDRQRHLRVPPGVCLHRMAGFADRVLWNLGPPRVRYDEAVVDLAADARTDLDALRIVADACGSRRTTAKRLLDALSNRPRVARRRWLEGVLRDLAEGTCSVLEHGYLYRVERPHGLPRGSRQRPVRASLGGTLRDVEYDELGLVVELDGRLWHSSPAARDRDLDRDLDAAVEGAETLRLGWGQVFGRACRTAERVGVVLQRRGWAGATTRCEECG